MSSSSVIEDAANGGNVGVAVISGGIARNCLRLTRELLRRPSGVVGMVLVVGFVVAGVCAPLLAPYDPNAQDIAHRLAGPSTAHLLGTDDLGRDLLSRVLFGARISLVVAAGAVGVAVVVGLALGVLGGYIGGPIDIGVVTMTDACQAFPALILALALLAVLGPSVRNVVIVIAFAFIPNYVRMSRALVLSLKQRPFILAERALGARTSYILYRHLLPSVIPPLLVLIAIDLSLAIVIEAGLSFLGVGVQPPTASWGQILSDGFQFIRVSPWGVISAGLALMLATIGFTLVSEVFRDVLDPKLASRRALRRP